MTSINNTLSGNTALNNGGGVFWNGGQVTLLNTTLSGNLAGGQGGNVYAGSAYNANISLKNSIVASGSPAIDAGTNSGCPATDQSGLARPYDGDSNQVAVCDLGAYELRRYELFMPLVRH